MSLLPETMLPPDQPFGRLDENGDLIIDHNWWLLLYNIVKNSLTQQPNAIIDSALTDTVIGPLDQDPVKAPLILTGYNFPPMQSLSPGQQVIHSAVTLDQNFSASAFAANYFSVTDNGSHNPGSYARVLECVMNLGGPTLTGSRASGHFVTKVTSQTANTPNPLHTYGCLNATALGQANDGGTGLTTTTACPNMSASNLIMTLTNGATNYYGASGLEVDITLENGSSTVISRGVAVTHLTSHQVRGVQEDEAFTVGSQNPNGFTTFGTVSVVGAAGQFSGQLTNVIVGSSLNIFGANTGTGSISGYTPHAQYYVSATDGISTFTLLNLKDLSPLVTTPGTLTGLTFAADWGTFGWKFGFCLAGGDPSDWPYARDSIAIGSPKGGTLATGLDWHLFTFWDMQVKGVGWTVDPVGNQTMGSVAAAGISSAPAKAPVVDAGNVGLVISQSGLAMIIPSSGTMGANGALTGIAALPTTYANAFLYFPAGAVFAASPAGWYFAQGTGVSAFTVFNNTWVSGTPQIPGTLIAVSDPGPGAYTQTTVTQNAANASIAGNVLGLNGSLEIDAQVTNSNSANVKTINAKYGGQILISYQPTTQNNGNLFVWMRNRGVTGAQTAQGWHAQATSATLSSSNPVYVAVDSTVQENAVIGLTLANAADFIVLESFSIKVYPN